MRSRVLLWVPRYWPAVGGAELHSRRLAKELAKSRSVRVLTHATQTEVSLEWAAAAGATQRIPDGDVEVVRVGLQGMPRKLLQGLAALHSRGRLWRWLYARALRLLLRRPVRELAADCGLIHAVYNGLTESAELAADTAQALGLPFVWTPLACTDGPLAGAWSTRRFRRLYRRAQAIVALTEHERAWLIAQGAPMQRVHVCPVGPLVLPSPSTPVRARLGLNDEPLILFVGRVTRDKGADRLVEAAPLVWQSYPSARFLFVGPPEPAMQPLFSAQQDARIVAWPEVSQDEKCAALAACDMLCLPSKAESLGGVLLEAWAYAKPVIAHDLPVLREVVTHGEDGLLTEHNASSLAGAIIALLDESERRERMGAAGLRKVTERYTWDHIATRMGQIYTAAQGRL